MFRSEEPCAIATTLRPPASSAEKTRAAIPGVPAMPSPTTAITAIPLRAVTPSISPVSISWRKTRLTLATARSASDSGTVKPMELSDEPWKMVETDSRSASTAVNVRAAMPCTPTMPLPATVTTAWAGRRASALTGKPGSTCLAVTSVPGTSGWMNDRTCNAMRVPAMGISARGCRTLAP